MFFVVQHSRYDFSRAVTSVHLYLSTYLPPFDREFSCWIPTYDNMHLQICLLSPNVYLDLKISIRRTICSAVEKASSIDLCHDLVSLLEQIVSQLQKHGWTEDSDRAFTTEMTSLLKQQIAGAILKSLAQSVLLSHHISYLWRGLDILLLYYCCTYLCSSSLCVSYMYSRA